MATYYDALLAAIPVLLGMGMLVSLHPAVALHQGLGLGAMLGTLVLFEAIFRNPPVEPTPGTVGSTVLVVGSWIATIVVYGWL